MKYLGQTGIAWILNLCPRPFQNTLIFPCSTSKKRVYKGLTKGLPIKKWVVKITVRGIRWLHYSVLVHKFNTQRKTSSLDKMQKNKIKKTKKGVFS